MANKHAAEKAIRVSARRRVRNRIVRSSARTRVRQAVEAIGDSEATSETQVREAMRALDKAASKGIITKNSAARRKSRLMKKLNAMKADSA